MEDKIRVLIVEPEKLPYEKVINNNLKTKQEIVGGLIEYASLDEYTSLICNEEGKIINLPVCREIGSDVIAGPFIIVGDSENHEDDISLTDEQIEEYKDLFNEESIERIRGRNIDYFDL